MVSIQNQVAIQVYKTESDDYQQWLNDKEKALVNQLCGGKYSRNTRKYVRYKTVKRTIRTKHGEFTRRFTYVKNTATGAITAPLLEHLDIDKRQRCSTELKQVMARKASRMPYRKAAEDIRDSFGFTVSGMAIHRYVKQTAPAIRVEQPAVDAHQVLLADGTKVRGKNTLLEPRVIMSIGERAVDKALLKLGVEVSWSDLAAGLDLTRFRVLVADGELGLREALLADGMRFQYCHEHAIRDVGICLWRDGLSKSEAQPFVDEFKHALYCLQKSTETHRVDRDWVRLTWRIQETKRRLRSLSEQLSRKGLRFAAAFIAGHVDDLTTAAELAVEGVVVPWTTNAVERVMQEVGVRSKRKGMYWSTDGLTRVLAMVLKRYFLPPDQRSYKEVFSTG